LAMKARKTEVTISSKRSTAKTLSPLSRRIQSQGRVRETRKRKRRKMGDKTKKWTWNL
jgi:hypothetical protein